MYKILSFFLDLRTQACGSTERRSMELKLTPRTGPLVFCSCSKYEDVSSNLSLLIILLRLVHCYLRTRIIVLSSFKEKHAQCIVLSIILVIIFRPKDPTIWKYRTPVDGVETDTIRQAVSVL